MASARPGRTPTSSQISIARWMVKTVMNWIVCSLHQIVGTWVQSLFDALDKPTISSAHAATGMVPVRCSTWITRSAWLRLSLLHDSPQSVTKTCPFIWLARIRKTIMVGDEPSGTMATDCTGRQDRYASYCYHCGRPMRTETEYRLDCIDSSIINHWVPRLHNGQHKPIDTGNNITPSTHPSHQSSTTTNEHPELFVSTYISQMNIEERSCPLIHFSGEQANHFERFGLVLSKVSDRSSFLWQS